VLASSSSSKLGKKGNRETQDNLFNSPRMRVGGGKKFDDVRNESQKRRQRRRKGVKALIPQKGQKAESLEGTESQELTHN